MNRSARVIVAVLALLLLVAGTAFATRSNFGDQHRSPLAASHQPASAEPSDSENEPSESPEAKTPEPSDATDTGASLTDTHAAELVDLLKAAGIDATADQLKTLAAKYGVGGAVRLLSWAQATGKTVDELAAMFDGGMGWGAIANKLNAEDSTLNLSPGIGWILGHGHGHGNAGGHANANANGHGKHGQGSSS